VCLVDDFTTCSDNYSTKFPYIFDKNTVVITDNHSVCPTQYQVLQLPSSFFGIYSHTPVNVDWNPVRKLNFSVNRIDDRRQRLLLEMVFRLKRIQRDWSQDYFVNFNCWSWQGNNSSVEDFQQNFQTHFDKLDKNQQAKYQETFEELLPTMPLCNHTMSYDQVYVSTWCNTVIETYASDTNIALSEKLFRALCVPVPWTVYSGKYTVAYLNQLGFDVLPDLVEHRYDFLNESGDTEIGDKIVEFIVDSLAVSRKLPNKNFNEIQARCKQAAQHNQKLLADMRQQWPGDFAAWWANNIQYIQ
jgi:hypothetical protein